MGILDSIKGMFSKTVDTVTDVASDVQEQAANLKADFDEAGGAQGLLDKAKTEIAQLSEHVSTELSELGNSISEVAASAADSVKETASNAVTSATETAAELKADFDEAGGAKGIFDSATNSIKETANQAVDLVKGKDDQTPSA
jgi:methyl-accepting chemotaxis protein